MRSRKFAVLIPLLLFLGVFACYLATAEREGVNVDANAASAGAWRIATAGTVFFDDLDPTQISGTHHPRLNGLWIRESPNGHVTAQRMPGPIIVGVPFYWVLGESGTDESDFSLAPAAFAASLLAALAVTLMYLAIRERAGNKIALAAALVFAFATPTWVISANGLWTHTITQLGIAGSAFAASRGRWGGAGAFLAFGMLGRPHLAVIAAVLGIGVAWRRKDWTIAARVAVPTAASLALLSLWNRYVHGEWSIGGPYGEAISRATSGLGEELGASQLLNYLGFLVSLNRGLLVWTPMLLLFIPALVRCRRDLPDWSWALLIGGFIYTFFQLRLNHFSGGTYFYSYRHGLELVTCLLPAAALASSSMGRIARALFPVLAALQIGTMTIGAVVEKIFVLPSDEWSDNGLLMALRAAPMIVGGWLALCWAIGLLISLRFMPYPPRRGEDLGISGANSSTSPHTPASH